MTELLTGDLTDRVTALEKRQEEVGDALIRLASRFEDGAVVGAFAEIIDWLGLTGTLPEDGAALEGRGGEGPPCAGCGGPHPFDTSVPSPTWNAVIREAGLPDFLCLGCIVAAFARAGQGFTARIAGAGFRDLPVEFRIGGKAAEDASRLTAENDRLRLALREIGDHASEAHTEACRPPSPSTEGREPRVGDRVRVTGGSDNFKGRTGVLEEIQHGGPIHGTRWVRFAPEGRRLGFHAEHLELLPPDPPPPRWKVGDKVRIGLDAGEKARAAGREWPEILDQCLGKVGVIIGLMSHGHVTVAVGDWFLALPSDSLDPVEPEPETEPEAPRDQIQREALDNATDVARRVYATMGVQTESPSPDGEQAIEPCPWCGAPGRLTGRDDGARWITCSREGRDRNDDLCEVSGPTRHSDAEAIEAFNSVAKVVRERAVEDSVRWAMEAGIVRGSEVIVDAAPGETYRGMVTGFRSGEVHVEPDDNGPGRWEPNSRVRVDPELVEE